MAVSNRDRVGKALERLKEGLAPYVAREMAAKYGANWQETRLPFNTRSLDTLALLKCILENWNDLFSTKLSNFERSLIYEMRDARNDFAHEELFTLDDAYRVFDSATRLLRAISAPQASDTEREMQEIRRVLYEDQTKREQKLSIVTHHADVRADPMETIGSFVKAQAARASKSSPLCECGCGDHTAGGLFFPGHDGKLKGRLIRTARAEGEDKSPDACEAAWNELVVRRWSHMFDEEQTRRTAERNRRGRFG